MFRWFDDFYCFFFFFFIYVKGEIVEGFYGLGFAGFLFLGFRVLRV